MTFTPPCPGPVRTASGSGRSRRERVAEHLVTSEFTARRGMLPGLLAGQGQDRLVRALTVLGRAALTDDRAGQLLRGALETGFEGLAVPAMTASRSRRTRPLRT